MIIHVALQAFTDHVSWRWYVILFYPTYSLAADTSLGVSGSTCTWSRLQPYVNYRPTCITSPTGGVALGFLFFTLHLNPPKHNKTFRQHVSEFDFLGLFLIVSGVICVLIGFNQSENSCREIILGVVVLLLMTVIQGTPPRLSRSWLSEAACSSALPFGKATPRDLRLSHRDCSGYVLAYFMLLRRSNLFVD